MDPEETGELNQQALSYFSEVDGYTRLNRDEDEDTTETTANHVDFSGLYIENLDQLEKEITDID